MPRFRSETLESLHRSFGEAAENWADLPPFHPLREYGFLQGVLHLMASGEPGKAQTLLRNFSYLQARTFELPSAEATNLARHYGAVLAKLPDHYDREAFRLWENFFRTRAHMLRRGDDHWPANRILLQLATEHAGDGPVAMAARQWLEQGRCDWRWCRRVGTTQNLDRGIVRVLEGHGFEVAKVWLFDGRLISGDLLGELREWNLDTGESVAYVGERGGVEHVSVSPEGLVATWGTHGTVHVWSEEGACWKGIERPWLDTLFFHGSTLVMSDHLERPAEWTERSHWVEFWEVGGEEPLETLESTRVWRLDDSTMALVRDRREVTIRVLGEVTASFEAGVAVDEVFTVSDDAVCLGSKDEGWEVWAIGRRAEPERLRHFQPAYGDKVTELEQGRLLYRDHTEKGFEVWDAQLGERVGSGAFGALPVLFVGPWDARSVVYFCHHEEGVRRVRFDGSPPEPLGPFPNALRLEDGRAVSWQDRQVFLWEPERVSVGRQQHRSDVLGAIELGDGRVLTWSDDGELALWDPATARRLFTLGEPGLRVEGCVAIGDRLLISWRLFVPWKFQVWDLQDGRSLGEVQSPFRANDPPSMHVEGGGTPGRIVAGSWSLRCGPQGFEVFEGDEQIGRAGLDPNHVIKLGISERDQRRKRMWAEVVLRGWPWHADHQVTPLLLTSESLVVGALSDGTVVFMELMAGSTPTLGSDTPPSGVAPASLAWLQVEQGSTSARSFFVRAASSWTDPADERHHIARLGLGLCDALDGKTFAAAETALANLAEVLGEDHIRVKRAQRRIAIVREVNGQEAG